MRAAGGRYDIAGNARDPHHLDELEAVRRAASGQMRLHVNAGQEVLEDIVGGARAYLQTSEKTLGVAVVEAIAAGCVPVVPDNSAHPETVPFDELRYGTEAGRRPGSSGGRSAGGTTACCPGCGSTRGGSRRGHSRRQ